MFVERRCGNVGQQRTLRETERKCVPEVFDKRKERGGTDLYRRDEEERPPALGPPGVPGNGRRLAKYQRRRGIQG